MNGDRVAISQLLVLQNYTRNNRTQVIVEKSQKNLKTWRYGKITLGDSIKPEFRTGRSLFV